MTRKFPFVYFFAAVGLTALMARGLTEQDRQDFDDWGLESSWGTYTNAGWVLSQGQTWSGNFLFQPYSPPHAGWLRDYDQSTNSWLRSSLLTNGVGRVIYHVRNRLNNDINIFELQYSTNAQSWASVGTFTNVYEGRVWNAYTNEINDFTPAYLRILKTGDTGSDQRLGLDDVVVYNPAAIQLSNLSHSPSEPTIDDSVHVSVTAVVHPVDLSAVMKLWYRFGAEGAFVSRAMVNTTGSTYRTETPIPEGWAGTVEYYVEGDYSAFDGGSVFLPEGTSNAPASYVSTDPYGGEPDPRQFGPSSRRTGLIISEIMYHPAARDDGKDLEFIEIYNTEPVDKDIGGYRLSGEIDFLFPDDTVVEARSCVVVAGEPPSIAEMYPVSGVYGPWSGQLSNGGGRIRLRNDQDAVLLEIDYEDQMPWPIETDGAGHSLVLAKPDYGEGDVRAWSSSERIGGSPGYALSERTGTLDQLQINEFLAHTDLPQIDFIELHNYGTGALDTTGCVLTDDPATNKYTITNGTIDANGFLAFDQNQLGFSLSMGGDDIYLIQPDGKRVLDAVRFEAQANGVSMGRWPDGAGDFHALAAITPGMANTNAEMLVADVVINELMYHPISGDDDDEYIELYNKGDTGADLSNWRFTDGVSFVFPEATTIPAGEYLVIARNTANLLSKYPQLTETNLVGNYSGQLSDGGERVALSRPDDPLLPLQDFVVVDEVTYGDGNRWGHWSDGGGSSLELVDPRADNRIAMNWAGSDETGKSEWVTVSVTRDAAPATEGITSTGTINMNELHTFLLQAGECLLDDVRVEEPGGAVLLETTFDAGLSGWRTLGTHETSFWEENGGSGGSGGMHLRATDPGDTILADNQRPPPYYNRLEATLASTISSGTEISIEARLRWLCGDPIAILILQGFALEISAEMPLPSDLGSPGQRNSRYAANAGPALTDTIHTPVLPTGGEDTVVQCRVDDPDGVSSVRLKYRIDPGTSLTTLTMGDDGVNGDEMAGDGIFSATLPGQASGSLVVFTIEGEDAAGVTNFFPELTPQGVPVKECLIRFGDPSSGNEFMTYRLWMTESNITEWTTRNTHNNTPLDGTIVYGNDRVVYNGTARYRGNWRAFNGPQTSDPCGFVLTVPGTERLLGAREIKMDMPGQNANDGTLQRETIGYDILGRAGLPFSRARFIRMRVNSRDKGILYDFQTPSRGFAESWYPDDPDPKVYRTMHDNGLNVYEDSEGKKWSERYRVSWELRRPNVPSDDYTPIYALAEYVMQDDDAIYDLTLPMALDVDGWLGMACFNHVILNSDAFGYGLRHNSYLYSPGYAAAMPFVYDLDNGLNSNDNTSANPFSSLDRYSNRMVGRPVFRRMYWRWVKTFAETCLDPQFVETRLDAWFQSFLDNGIGASSPSGVKTWLAARRAYLLTQVATVDASLEITTNGGADFSTSEQITTLSGTAPVEVDRLRINGAAHSVTYTSVTNWQMEVSLEPGTNALTIDGLLRDGSQAANMPQMITITYTGPAVSPEGKLVINEIMYSALDSYGDFVEIHNLSDADTFDLGGMRLNGLDFDFMSGTFIGPTGYVVVSESMAGYAAAYSNAGKVVGEYAGSLDNGGETISLLMPVGSNGWTVLDQVTYDNSTPWPVLAAGAGPSLQLRDATRDNSRVGNWGVDTTVLYTPGEANLLSTNLPAFPQVWLNEVMPSNASFAADNTGDFDPWVEIYNAETQSVDLGGEEYYLTDDYSNLTQWAFLSGNTIDADSYALVWADGEPAETTGTHWHASFRLNSASGSVALVRMYDGSPMVVDYLDYSGVPADNSYGSYPDGDSSGRQLFHFPTPGTANNNASLVTALYINEWMADNETTLMDTTDNSFDDWFEIYNSGTQTVNLTGFTLTDDLSDTNKFTIPLGFQVDARDFLLVWADNDSEFNGTGSDLHVDFGLNNGGEAIGLYAPDGTPVDWVTFGPQMNDVGEGRWRDGQGGIYQMPIATPGASNVLFQVLDLETVNSDSLDLSWQTSSGQTYAVWCKSDLITTSPWVLYTNGLVSTGSTMSVTVSLGTNNVRYFKVGHE